MFVCHPVGAYTSTLIDPKGGDFQGTTKGPRGIRMPWNRLHLDDCDFCARASPQADLCFFLKLSNSNEDRTQNVIKYWV